MNPKYLFKAYCVFIILNLFALYGEISWQTPALLFEEDQKRKDPILSINLRGNAVIGWVNGDDEKIEIVEYDFINNKMHCPRVVFPTGSAQVNLLDLILLENNDLYILWEDKKTDCLLAAKFDRQQNVWVDTISLPESHYIEKPVLKIDAHDNALIGWTKFTGFEYQVQSIYFSTKTKRWGKPITLSPIGYNCHLQKFAFDSRGNAVAVWKTTLLLEKWKSGNNYGIQAVCFDVNDATWSKSPFFFEAYSNLFLTTPDIIFDAQDNFIILWKKEHITTKEETLQFIAFNRLLNKWGNKTDILTEGVVSNPKLIFTPQQVYAVWHTIIDGEEKLKSLALNYPGALLPAALSITEPLKEITEYKIKVHPNGRMKILYTGNHQVRVSEFREEWKDIAIFGGQPHAKTLQLEGDLLGNTIVMWKKERSILYSLGDYLLPPSQLSARIVEKRFPAKIARMVQLTWSASMSPKVEKYRIRKNNALIAEVHCSQLQFLDRHLQRGESVYSVTAVNHHNLESRPMEFVIRK